MRRILFSHSYFLHFDPKQWETGQPYPPLGTLYAAALLRKEGYEVSLFDTMFVKDPLKLIEPLNNIVPEIFVIYDDGFNYLTKMCLTNMREAAFKMCKLAKERGCTVIVSSSDSTDHYEKYLFEGADYILVGEAEHTLLELCNALGSSNFDPQSILGLAYELNGAIIKTARRPVLKDLDSLPMPAWDLINMNDYRTMWMQSSGYFSLNMGTTRGCPFKCNWCAKPIYGNRYHSRSPEHVVEELKFLKTNFNMDHIWFSDDIFGLKPGWVDAFAKLVNEQNIKVKFKIQARADLLVQENYVASLAAAGCDNVWMGAESGSQKILDAMDKGIKIEDIYEATRLLKKHAIKPSFFIQFGYLGETWNDIRQTINMINELLPHSIGISVSYPLPGTLFYEKVKDDLKEKANWTDSDELQLMFRNTYQPAFYKQLHQYVHQTYRKHKAIDQIKNIFSQNLRRGQFSLKKALSYFYYLPASFFAKLKLLQLKNVMAK